MTIEEIQDQIDRYEKIHDGEPGFYQEKRALIAVWGKEAVQFLNGLITNDVAKLEDGAQMAAAFPNVQGRLIALVRVLRQGEKFLFETEEITHEKVFTNLHRFTFAGDFFVEDLSDNFAYFEIFNSDFGFPGDELILFKGKFSTDCFVPNEIAEKFAADIKASGALEIFADAHKALRIENGVPKYGVDMDETTVVLETGLDDAVSFTKGCYIGQEIIARIHFRGHVAKKLTGLVLSDHPPLSGWDSDASLTSAEGKPAGRITSFTHSAATDGYIALGYVRYEFLAEGTELKIGDVIAKVTNFPVI